MPYIAINKQTGQVWTGMLTNSYKLTYYGTKYWDWEDEAADELVQFLQGQGVEGVEDWAAFEVEEGQLKRYNVKLKNDPSWVLYLDEAGQAIVRKRDE
jgi:hypothetical protein